MANTIYATFLTEADAERAAGALMDHGIAAEDISFVLPENLQTVETHTTHPVSRTHSVDAAPPPAAPLPDSIPVTDTYVPSAPPLPNATVLSPGRDSNVAEGVRPGYTYDALGAVLPDRPVGSAGITATPVAAPNPPVEVREHSSDRATIPADTPLDTMEHDTRAHIMDMNRHLPDAASGVTTTTAGDAAKGALEGAGIGVGLGILLGLAAVAIPGIGLVAGAGALVAGLAAATGAAGGIAGGVYGYLADMGLPPDTARLLSDHLKAGGPVLSITASGPLMDEEIVRLLKKYGATSAQGF
jgi:hypothetical protein